MEGVSQNGFAAPDEAARLKSQRLESGREKRRNEAVRCACCERRLRSGDGAKQHKVCAGACTFCALRNLTLNLRDDCLRLGKPVEMLGHLAQLIVRNDMKAAIAPRSWYQLRGAGWR